MPYGIDVLKRLILYSLVLFQFYLSSSDLGLGKMETPGTQLSNLDYF